MGRVKSRIRHDYKPGRRRRKPGGRLRRFLPPAVAAGAAVVFVALLIGGEETPAPVGQTLPDPAATPAGPAPERSADGPASGFERRALSLPHGGASSADAGEPPADPETVVAAEPSAAPEHETGAAPSSGEADDERAAAPAADAEVAAAPAAESAGQAIVLKVRKGDSLDTLFRRNELSVVDLARMLKIKEAKNSLRTIQPGDEIEVVREQERVLSLTRRLDEQVSIRVVADGDEAYRTEFLTHPVERRRSAAQGKIDSSLFLAGAEAGMSDTLIMNFAGIFAWDVDFALGVRKNDSFSLVYEEVWQDGRKLRDGEILAAEFVNSGEVFRAVRFEDPEGRVSYFTPEGRSVRKAFLRAPLDFRRVSSNFNPNRLHPILKTKRPHRGVDYAANRGTPVKAAGDGRIIHRGRKGGYGNTVIIQHGGNITTLYAHLSRFANGQTNGGRVRQGQVIGYVGATGLATAPHLHYEYRVNGVHRNPRTVPLPAADPVPDAYRELFAEATRPLLDTLDAISPTRLAAGRETLAAVDSQPVAGTP
jgi:murein DD-endopeptidase MepM/ murein hydrolase activator NlpD